MTGGSNALATYSQRSGLLRFVENGRTTYLRGFAGRRGGLNNHLAQTLSNTGPLPVGFYRAVVLAHPRFKAPAIRLDPYQTNQMYGRSGFWIHGGKESHGCIILQKAARQRLVAAGVTVLEVVPDHPQGGD